jgi:hypothetical protein
MIDFKKIKEQPTARTIFREIAANAIQLFFILYGLKCIISLHGKMLITSMGAVYHHNHLVPVSDFVSVMIGLSYLCGGLFLDLSYGRPPNENRAWLWKFCRSLTRSGCLLLTIAFWHQAHLLSENAGEKFFDFLPSIANSEDRRALLLISITIGIILLLGLLIAIFIREQVKKTLWANGCKSIHIWWCPLAYWVPWVTYMGAIGFRTIYSDTTGFIHKGYCIVYRSFHENSQWGNFAVKWLTDTVTSQLPSPEVWADSEIIRPKLSDSDELTGEVNSSNNPNEPE